MPNTPVMALGFACKQKAQRERHTEHPLTHGLMWQDIINQQNGTIRHSTCTATGVETPFLATERDQFLILTGFTADSKEPVLKPPALKVLIKFLYDIRW